MKNVHMLKRLLAGLVLVATPYASRAETSISDKEMRQKALTEMHAGNYNDALGIFRTLALNPDTPPAQAGDDLDHAVSCYQSLNRVSETDAFREDVIAAHSESWRVLFRAASSYFDARHYGTIVAGNFERGSHRGGGQYVNSFERDRFRALQLMEQARAILRVSDATETGEFYLSFARFILGHRGIQDAWRLQYLTDLSECPDYDQGYGYRGGGEPRGAPVDEDGNPVLYRAPKTYADAASDGERWRWMLEQAIQAHPTYAARARSQFADFLYQQFGVQTLQSYGGFFARTQDADEDNPELTTYALHTLGENETMARLATGIKRFALPDEFNFIRLYRQLKRTETLAGIFENRRQYDRAADLWKQAGKTQQVEQILGNWGRFDSVMTFPAGKHAALQYIFRNGRQLHVEAHAIHTRTLLDDVKAYLRSNPSSLDWNQVQVENIGHRLVRENQAKYIGERVATWDVSLTPRPMHFDKRIPLEIPLSQPGAYLLTARIEGGNTSKIIVWINDTIIVRKPLDQRAFFFVADAVTGNPIPTTDLDFFGYRQERTNWNKLTGRRYTVQTRDFKAATDSDGQFVPEPEDFDSRYQWLISTSDDSGRFAYMGFDSVWTGRNYDREYRQTKVFTITDRPVYRPDQAVQFKTWVRHARYDAERESAFAGQPFTVRIINSMNETVFEKAYTADPYGGVDGQYVLPNEAALGTYRIQILNHGGSSTFRVEEYKKPEFEVVIDAPDRPVMLGETIEATIRATYYFGAPVTKATVRYKVLRSAHTSHWYPEAEWDWFYGPGYWWFASNYDWYPGWRTWGCIAPPSWWWPRSSEPPEVVAEAETPVGPDGTARIRIDTALAKALHGNTDHRYEITAEVVDESRRSIVGRGEVLVARQPFRVYAWLDRGHYTVGDVILAHFSAQTLARKPVTGKGIVRLYRISYVDEKPIEHMVQHWIINPASDGRTELQFKASEPGQYRMSHEVTDAEGHTVEGGYIFCIRGQGFDGKQFRFNEIELIPDKKQYADGETANVMVNTDRAASTVLLFVRPANGVYLMPRVVRLKGKSIIEPIAVSRKDMPNFFIEALTVSDGRVYSKARELVVPPEERVLEVDVTPSRTTYQPGEEATVRIRLTDFLGKPFIGSTVISVYDKALEYISGGSNVPGIKAFFWKWRRQHQPMTRSSIDRSFSNIVPPKGKSMSSLGAFGHLIADQFNDQSDLTQGSSVAQFKGGIRAMAMSKADGERGAVMAAVAVDALSAPMPSAEPAAFSEERLGANGIEPEALSVEPAIRTEFADTAFWVAALETDTNGEAEVTFTMPENLTGWTIRTWAMGHGTRVGESTANIATSKNLLLRMQAPRFFVERDEVVLSANIHNYLDGEKAVTAVLDLEGGCLEHLGTVTNRVVIGPKGEARIDWRIRVIREGEAIVRMKALTDEESDAMEMRFPVYVHGMLTTESFSGVVRPEQDAAGITFDVPAQRRIDQSRLELRYSPTLAGALVDALPYLAAYPYGCTEQTLSRFLPAVMTQRILREMGLDLAEIKAKRTNLNAQEIGDDVERAKQWKQWDTNPVFDEEKLDDMVRTGIRRLSSMQLEDGGWGWFSGWGAHSYAHTTAYVVHGLQLARHSGIQVDDGLLSRGIQWLEAYQAGEQEKIRNAPQRTRPWKLHADNLDAFVYMVLNEVDSRNDAMNDFLYRDRNDLSVYAKAMYGLALHRQKQTERRDMIRSNIEQYLVEDAENQTAYLNLPNGGYWWAWYGSEYEAHAYYLKLLAAVDPVGTKAASLVKYLLNNRKHGSYWKSTRDTAVCIEAMADYLRASGENRPDMTVEILIDGVQRQEARITADNLFTFNNHFILEGDAVTTGRHHVEVRRTGTGPVYFNAYLSHFTLEDFITKAGLEIKVERKYYRLVDADRTVKAAGARGQAVDQRVDRYERQPVSHLDQLTSGDLIEIELEIESKNDYEYVVFEDMKAAGCEPIQVRSGYTGKALGAYMELRDEKVCFFVRSLARGRHSLSYRMRAETPGTFSALPTRVYAMYAPELKANSDEIKLRIVD